MTQKIGIILTFMMKEIKVKGQFPKVKVKGRYDKDPPFLFEGRIRIRLFPGGRIRIRFSLFECRIRLRVKLTRIRNPVKVC